MAFYVVADGKRNKWGEANTFVVRASGVRQAAALAPLADAKNATVTKLEDGRDVENSVILGSLVEFDAEDTSAGEDVYGVPIFDAL